MHIKSCGAIPFIETDKTRFLLVKHIKGHWDFPKGKQESGESDKETAMREVLEETGVSVNLLKPRFETHYSPQSDVEKTVVWFLGRASDDEININDPDRNIVDAVWLDYDVALERLTFDNSKKLLVIAANSINS